VLTYKGPPKRNRNKGFPTVSPIEADSAKTLVEELKHKSERLQEVQIALSHNNSNTR
jgi:hypothetical protein